MTFRGVTFDRHLRVCPFVTQIGTLVVSKLDRLARAVPDARTIAEELRKRGVKLALGATVHDSTDPMGKMFFNIVATFAEFEADLITMRTRGGHGNRKGEGQAARETAKTVGIAAEGTLANARYRGVFDQRARRGLLRITTNHLSNIEQTENRLECHFALSRSRPQDRENGVLPLLSAGTYPGIQTGEHLR